LDFLVLAIDLCLKRIDFGAKLIVRRYRTGLRRDRRCRRAGFFDRRRFLRHAFDLDAALPVSFDFSAEAVFLAADESESKKKWGGAHEKAVGSGRTTRTLNRRASIARRVCVLRSM